MERLNAVNIPEIMFEEIIAIIQMTVNYSGNYKIPSYYSDSPDFNLIENLEDVEFAFTKKTHNKWKIKQYSNNYSK